MVSFVFIKVALSLLLVIALMYGALKLLQRCTKLGISPGSQHNEIKVSSIVYVDENTKIVSISNKQKNYILGVNKNNILLIDKYEKPE